MRRSRSGSVAVVLTAAFALSSIPAATATTGPDGETSSYVALGDSYTSASLVPRQTDLACTRSSRNYPSLVAAELGVESFTDVSCGGATTEDMTEPQGGFLNDPQFDALRPDTGLVTVGIGGNDIPFVEVLVVCSLHGLVPHGSPCKDYYQRSGTDRLVEKVEAVGPLVGGVLDGIRERSPGADVLVIGYPTILPDDGSNCWPLVPIAAGDAPYLRDITKLLNEVIATEAAARDMTFVDTYTSSVGHDMCRPPGEKWLEGMFPTSPAAPVHPNALGARNQADQVLASLTTTSTQA